MEKIIINFTPTGMLPTKKETPYVPVTPAEIIQDVRDACELGITMVHLHARDPQTGIPSHSKEIYAQIIQGIREFSSDLIICVSTSGRINNTYEARSEVLFLEGELKPDMASLTLSSLNFNRSASINEPKVIYQLAETMKKNGILPELEIFDLGMTNYMNYLVRKDILTKPYYANIILGNIASAQTDLMHIGCIIKDLPSGSIVSLGAVGDQQVRANSLAIAMGYGVRVGIEDNFWFDEERTRLASNRDLILRIRNIIEANQKAVMTPNELRQLLNLQNGKGAYGLKP